MINSKIMKTKLLYLTVVLGMILGLTGCNLDYAPDDQLSSSVLFSDISGAEAIMDGCYTMMKEEYDYVDPYPSGNSYVRHYFQMAEFPADNTCLSGRTTDNLYEATCYKMTDNLKNNSHIWWISYKIIFTANNIIEGLKEGKSTEEDQLIGEAYFLRAMMHFNLCNLFAKPYILGRDNMGVILRTSTNTENATRASVGDVYDQVVADLTKAAELMKKPRHAGNPGYATKNAALGLLSRVYLYMEENQKVLDVIAEMGDPTSHLDGDFSTYFADAVNREETLFASVHTSLETRGSGSIGSMYNGDGGGWGEVYASFPLIDLYGRYPNDQRLSYIRLIEETDTRNEMTGKPAVFFPVKSDGDEFRSNLFAELKTDASGKYCVIDGTTYRINEKKVNGMNQPDDAGEYTAYTINYGGEECVAHLFDKFPAHRFNNPNYFVTKFSYQNGDPMLSSPVFLRWAEIVLNRAEANAKLGNTSAALTDVNAIRTRAGLSGTELFDAGNMHGYTDVLDVVLDERRMELAFEGHRYFDVYRNRRDMDRRFPGIHPWEVIPYTADKIQYPIPYVETSVSHIDQNPGY